MTKVEVEALQERIKAMTEEEQLLALQAIPFDVLWNHVYSRVNRLDQKLNSVLKHVNRMKED